MLGFQTAENRNEERLDRNLRRGRDQRAAQLTVARARSGCAGS